jgi:hypothetical protein
VIKSRKIKWTGNIARVAEKGIACKVLVDKLEGFGLLKTSVDGKALLKWVLQMRCGRVQGYPFV